MEIKAFFMSQLPSEHLLDLHIGTKTGCAEISYFIYIHIFVSHDVKEGFRKKTEKVWSFLQKKFTQNFYLENEPLMRETN